MTTTQPQPAAMIQTVRGEIVPDQLGICDAHNHLWIERVGSVAPDAPYLGDFAAIAQELADYKNAGGSSIVDCQPGGCGRNARQLARLANTSDIHVVTCTGFHLPKYYPPDYWLFSATPEQARDHFVSELLDGTTETRSDEKPVRPGFIKVACEATLEDTPTALIGAAIAASLQTGAAILAHTQRGQAVEDLLAFCQDRGLPADRLMICHIDKRPDLGLHRELALSGTLLEYDTFYRPKYAPAENLWPLIAGMVQAGLGDRVALGLDMAEAELWATLGDGPGLVALLADIKRRLEILGIDEAAIGVMLGGNVANWLAH